MANRAAPLLLALSGALFAPTLAPAQERGAAPAPPPIRAIPGVTAPDPFPNACVDCHLNYTDRKMDVRLSTLMASWREKVDPRLLAKARAAASADAKLEGRHPDVPRALASVPGGCRTCHAKDSPGAPPLAPLIHSIHLTGGAENHFIAHFQGECTHCHKLDAKTGVVRVPSAPER